MGYVLILLGLGLLGVASAALIQGHVGWARIGSRKTAVVVMIVGVLVVGVGGALLPRPTAGTAANSATSTARSAPSSIPTIATTAPKTTAKPSSTKRAAGGGNTAAAPGPADSRMWNALAECESSGDWAIDTGNGLYGGLQIDRSTWLSYGGQAYAPLPSKATREQQILIAEKVRAKGGFSPWSSCARKLGLR
jgi:resuscitation-promoting factor RpfB